MKAHPAMLLIIQHRESEGIDDPAMFMKIQELSGRSPFYAAMFMEKKPLIAENGMEFRHRRHEICTSALC